MKKQDQINRMAAQYAAACANDKSGGRVHLDARRPDFAADFQKALEAQPPVKAIHIDHIGAVADAVTTAALKALIAAP